MASVPPTPALARLRGTFPPRVPARVLLHRGTCGDAAGAEALRGALDAAVAGFPIVETACDGACWAAPAATVQRDGHHHRFARLDRGVPDELAACLAGRCEDEYAGRGRSGLLERVGRRDGSFAGAVLAGAYAAFARAATLPPLALADALRASGLERRFSPLPATSEDGVLLVDARDAHGVVRHRHLLQGDPHRVIEGVLIACRVAGLSQARVYLDGDAPRSHAVLATAIDEAAAGGIMDGSALGGSPCTIEVVSGPTPAGAVEGEAVCALTTIFDAPPPPTRLVSLSGAIPRPGLYELPIDGSTTWHGVLALAGATPGLVPGILLGGLDGRIIPAEEFAQPLAAGDLGAGGVLVLPRDADVGA